MSGDRYIIADQNSVYFVTATVVQWIDVFTRRNYKDIIVNSLNFCTEVKGLEIHAWVLMTNHLHMLCRAREGFKLSEILRDFKKFTSKQIVFEIKNSNESRSDWLLDKFSFEARRTRRAKDYKIWQDSNHAIELSGFIGFEEKLTYIHSNPLRAGWVYEPQDFVYSSAIDYCGGKGLVNVTLV